jgi:tight adherence protein C
MEFATIIIFIIVFAVAVKIGLTFAGTEKVAKRRMAEMVDVDEGFAELQDEYSQEKTGIAITLDKFSRMFKNVDKEQTDLEKKLIHAGWTSPNAVAYYIFLSTFGWVFGLITIFFFYIFAKGYEGAMFYVIMAVGIFNSAMIAFGAQLWIKNATAHRQKVLTRSFPDALDLLLVCVESGLALDAALARVCNELRYAHPLITNELNKTRLELTMLNDREKALINLGERTDMICFKSLIAALLQSEKFGTSLVETLRVLSDDYRQTRMMVAEEVAGKLPTKISVVSIPFLLLALIILITGPAALSIMDKTGPNKAKHAE